MKKNTRILRKPSPILSCSIAALLAAPAARAATVYWDTNSTAAGAGAVTSGTWGVNNFWNTDPLGSGTGAFQTATTSADNLQFVAGPAIDSGNNPFTVTVSGTQSANTLTFLAPGATTLSGGSLIILGNGTNGNGGISVPQYAFDTTGNGAVTISTPITVNNNQVWSNDSASTLTIQTGTLSLGAKVLTGSGAGSTVISSNIASSAGSIIKTGAGSLTLSGSNAFTAGVTLSSGTLNINNAYGLGTGTFIIGGGTIDNTSGGAITTRSYVQTWNGDFAFTGASDGTHNLNLGTGAVSLGSTAGTRTVTVNAGNLTVGGIISNGTATSLTKAGLGTLTLSGANTFNGGVTLSTGTLNVNAAAALGVGTLTINGGTLADSSGGAITTTNAQVWNGDFGFSTNPALPAILGTYIGYNEQALTLGTGAVSLGSASGTTRTITTNGYFSNLTVGGVISNGSTANSLTKNGAGILTLSGVNLFSGGITLNAGKLNIGNAAALGSGTLTINGGSLAVTANTTVSTNNAQVWNGDFSFLPTTGNAFTLNTGTGAVTLGGNRVVTAIANTLTEGGVIGDSGRNYGVTWVSGYANNNATSITLTGSSTYGGATVLQSQNGLGTVTMATGYLANTSSVTVNGVGKFVVGNTTAATNRINPAATLTLGGNGGGTFQLVNSTGTNKQSFASLTVGSGNDLLYTESQSNVSQITVTGATPYTRNVGGVVRMAGLLGNGSSSTTFTNAVTGSGNIIGSGANAMLIGASTSAGTTTTDAFSFVGFTSGLASGTLTPITSTADTFGSGVNTTLNANSFGVPTTGTTQSLRFDGGTTLTLPSAFNVESGGLLTTYNVTTPITLTGGTLKTGLAGGDLWIVQSNGASAGSGMVIKSQIVDNSGSSLTKVGQRALYLTNTNNTYSGGTYLADGILNVPSEGSLGSGAINFTGMATLQAGGNVALGSRAVNIASGAIATFDTNGNSISVNGVVSGSNSGLTKVGLGTLTLTGSNSYTGITALQYGTLKLDFSAPGAPVSNIINPNSLLAAGVYTSYNNSAPAALSDTLLIQGAANTANSQTFGATNSPLGTYGATTLGVGMTNLVLTAGTNGSLTVNLGNIFRNGGAYLDVSTSDSVNVVGVNVNLMDSAYLATTFSGGGGNNSAWATVNKSTWATVTAAGNLVGVSAYTANTAATTSGIADIVTSGTFGAATTVRFNDTNSTGLGQTLTLNGTSVSQLSRGGILVTSNVGAHDSTISGGFLTGANLSYLGIFQNNTQGNLIINSQLTDQAANSTVFKNGAGTMILNGVNTNSGFFYVNEGTVIATGDYLPTVTAPVTTTQYSNTVGVSSTNGIFVGQALNAPGLAVANGGRPNIVTAIIDSTHVMISNTASATAGVSGTFSSGGAIGGALPTSTGGAPNAYIAYGATLQIGSAATGNHGGIDPNMQISNQGALILNHSGAYSFGNLFSGVIASNSLAGTVGMNTFEVTGGGTTTVGFGGMLTGTGASGQNIYTLTAPGNVYAGQQVTGTNIPGELLFPGWMD